MTPPQIADFKALFVRDFKYSNNSKDRTMVCDDDLMNALMRAGVNFPCFFGDQTSYSLAYLTLSAHKLCMALGASSKGITGQGVWLTTSKSVGSVSESYGVPDRIMNNPVFAELSKTRYGMEYLVMCLPRLVGAVVSAHGGARPL